MSTRLQLYENDDGEVVLTHDNTAYIGVNSHPDQPLLIELYLELNGYDGSIQFGVGTFAAPDWDWEQLDDFRLVASVDAGTLTSSGANSDAAARLVGSYKKGLWCM